MENQGPDSAYIGRRSVMVGPWHYCARCGSRVHIAEMIWQFGILVCKTWDCQDYGNKGVPLIGQREAGVARAVAAVGEGHELMPDPKLIEPSESGDIEEELIY